MDSGGSPADAGQHTYSRRATPTTGGVDRTLMAIEAGEWGLAAIGYALALPTINAVGEGIEGVLAMGSIGDEITARIDAASKLDQLEAIALNHAKHHPCAREPLLTYLTNLDTYTSVASGADAAQARVSRNLAEAGRASRKSGLLELLGRPAEYLFTATRGERADAIEQHVPLLDDTYAELAPLSRTINDALLTGRLDRDALAQMERFNTLYAQTRHPATTEVAAPRPADTQLEHVSDGIVIAGAIIAAALTHRYVIRPTRAAYHTIRKVRR